MGLINDKIAVLYISQQGRIVAEHLAQKMDSVRLIDVKGDFMNRVADAWKRSSALICVMAAGIVVRAIAPLVKDKYTDPCVVVVDESARFSISLLSGHIGGGNQLAEHVADCLGCSPIVTTASDNFGLTALDLWLKHNFLLTEERELLTKKSAKLNREKKLTCYIDMQHSGMLPDDIVKIKHVNKADIVITHDAKKVRDDKSCLTAWPKTLFLGVGCNRYTSAAEIDQCFSELLSNSHLKKSWFKGIASIDLKIDEIGLVEFARMLDLPVSFYSKIKLNSVEDVAYSEAVMKATGAKGVAEPAAILMASGREQTGELLIKKQKWPNVTMAVSREILRLK